MKEDLKHPNTCGLKVAEDGTFFLQKTHNFYYQIQGQLAITKRDLCDLFIWCPADSVTVRIDRNFTFWTNLVPKLNFFYMDCIHPEIVDPRATRSMPLREPHYITEAITRKKQKENNQKRDILLE